MSRLMNVIAVLGLVCLANAQYTLNVNKELNDGKAIPQINGKDVSATFTFTEKDQTIEVSYEIPEELNTVSETRIYFANKTMSILEVTVTQGKADLTLYTTPYNKASATLEGIVGDTISANKAVLTIETQWIPSDVTAVSASFTSSYPNENTIYNYYGIKNYDISIPDRMVVGSYMPVSFSNTGNAN